jgi:hypothetical protein
MSIFDNILRRFVPKKAQVSKEDFANSSDWIKAITSGGVGGFKNKFVSDIYKERTLFPHEEMLITQKAFNYNAYISSAVRTRAQFMTGGRILIESEDKKTADVLNALIKKTAFTNLIQYMGINLINAGNFYAERIFKDGQIIFYDYVPAPERMYIEVDDKGFVTRYFQEVPELEEGKNNFETIKYYGDRRKQIKGQSIDKNKIFHLKFGVSEIPQYGRGYTAAVVNDVEILLEIERAIAIIARYKAIPKKLFQLDRENPDTQDGKVAEFYANQLSNMSDLENPFIPETLKIDDLSYSGKDVNFEPFVGYLKKKITVALAPSFIMHGDETNYAVSKAQLETFNLTVQGEREVLETQLKQELKILARTHGYKNLAEFEVVFGEYDLGQKEEEINNTQRLFTSNIITLNEARDALGYPEDKELGDSYSSELNTQGNLFGLGSDESEEKQN